MSVVTAARYNTLQTKVSNVLGTGSSDKGYGVTVTSGQVAAGDVVTASHLALVHADINKCILFQKLNIHEETLLAVINYLDK